VKAVNPFIVLEHIQYQAFITFDYRTLLRNCISKAGVGSILGYFAFVVGLSLLQALLGFVALKPTYILQVLLRNPKPNNGRWRD